MKSKKTLKRKDMMKKPDSVEKKGWRKVEHMIKFNRRHCCAQSQDEKKTEDFFGCVSFLFGIEY